ncbi:unnamed protein product [Nyctereutes procyonoides]|uniref:(raccoon dog) hypothetical protein n=1 Tax=Nyctereutes procyonoides TaxID=34880 RepID=A0A811ZYQ1_NYCPR|nr:unnamed protein product [Nyctereutes procyonoides]
MALGLPAAGRAGEAALRNRLPAPATDGSLPSRPGRRVLRGGAPGPGTAQPARPPCRTVCLAPRGLVPAPAPTVLPPASSPSSLSATRSSPPTSRLHPAQLSLRRASTLKPTCTGADTKLVTVAETRPVRGTTWL